VSIIAVEHLLAFALESVAVTTQDEHLGVMHEAVDEGRLGSPGTLLSDS